MTSQPVAAPAASERTRLFISYSRRDEASVLALVRLLESDGSIDAFLDKDDILPAEAWRARLAALIRQTDAFVLCVSPDTVKSEVVAWEIESALAANKRIVPVLLKDTPADDIPDAIAQLNFVFLREQDSSDDQVARLRMAVQTNIEWVREHTRLEELAQRWHSDGRRAADQLRGPALESSERWLSLQPREAPAPTQVQRDYVAFSRAGSTGRQRGWIVGSLLVAAVSIGLSILAYWQRNEATAQRTDANARRLVAEAQAVLSDSLAPAEVATQSLLASLKLRVSAAAQRALKVGVTRLEPLPSATLPWPDAAGMALASLRFSPDGAWLAAMTGKALLVWSTHTNVLRIQHLADFGKLPGKLVFAADGRYAMVPVGASKASSAGQESGTGKGGGVGRGPDSQSAGVEAGTGAIKDRLLLLDLNDGSVKEVVSGRVLDAASIDGRLVALVTGPALTQVRAIDPVSGGTLWQVTSAQPVKLGRLVPSSAKAGARSALPGGEVPNLLLMLAQGPPRVADIVLADQHDRLSLWRLDSPAPLHSVALPAGASVLSFGELGRLAAVRLTDRSLTVFDVFTGKQQWHGGARSEGGPIVFTGGDRFVVTNGDRGPRLQSIAGGLNVEMEDARRSDWDMQALANVEHYSAIIDAGSSDDGSILATVWKDGRVDVWRPGLKPRYGAIDAMPRINFEAAARFDHGDDLGATAPFWTASPPLFVSPSGRFVASQSMGLRTNAIGGFLAAEPMVKIWDTRQRSESARFRRLGGMLLAFSPRDDLLATVSEPVTAGTATDAQRMLRLELWRLSEPPFEVSREQTVFALPLSAPPGSKGPAAPAAQWRLPATPASGDTIWLGMDRRLRMLDPQTGRFHVLEDLGPAAQEAYGVAQAAADRLVANLDATQRKALDGRGMGSDPYLRFMPLHGLVPPESPIAVYPIAVSGDRRRAVVKLGSMLRIYALDEKRLLSTVSTGDEIALSAIGMFPPEQLVLSNDGAVVAVALFTAADAMRAVTHDWSGFAKEPDQPSAAMQPVEFAQHMLVLDVTSKATLATVEQKIEVWPIRTPGMPVTTSSRLLAVSNDAKLLALERQRVVLSPGQPPTINGRLIVLDTHGNAIRLETPPWSLPSPLDMSGLTSGFPRSAAFSPSGRRLLIDRTGPTCPLKLEVHPMTNMPMQVPSCPDLSTTLTLWDVSSGESLRELSFDAPASKAAQAGRPGFDAPDMSAMFGVVVRPYSVSLADENAAVRSAVKLMPSTDYSRMDMRLTTERISLNQEGHLARIACGRLPSDMRAFPAASWARLLPGESYRAICDDSLPR